ncbi:hypothetical protein [Variovorax sp. dw_954]|uniref:hypothetical protein n=1 Tax=Variovorax sp. dw_954 TaxID=2720078 RepID=UPI001BD47897|nr:hypothetical protein [Variovorax sp. dw_954]
MAEASAHVRNPDDLAAELLGHGIDLGWVAVAVAEEPHRPACTPLVQIALLDHGGDGGTLGLWGYRFTPKAVFSAWMSGWASASSFLSLLFSAARWRLTAQRLPHAGKTGGKISRA